MFVTVLPAGHMGHARWGMAVDTSAQVLNSLEDRGLICQIKEFLF